MKQSWRKPVVACESRKLGVNRNPGALAPELILDAEPASEDRVALVADRWI